MADVRGVKSGGSCNEGCGCAVPCPGGEGCRCDNTASSGRGREHMKCSCGEHCGCNPCNQCTTTQPAGGVGKAYCKCSPGCGCVKCAS